jgi:hypothetical protein
LTCRSLNDYWRSDPLRGEVQRHSGLSRFIASLKGVFLTEA